MLRVDVSKQLGEFSLQVTFASEGPITGLFGASGAGKSVLLRTILGLTRKQSGTIKLFGVDVEKASDVERLRIDMRLGVLFQHGALFSALTVLENVQVPMREYLDLPKKLMDELALLKVELVGLPPDAALKYPSELSGGMIMNAIRHACLCAIDGGRRALRLEDLTEGIRRGYAKENRVE